MNNNKAVLYVHGKGGNASEAEFYEAIFPERDVVGFDYKAETPWESIGEFQPEIKKLLSEYDSVILVANSIGGVFLPAVPGRYAYRKGVFYFSDSKYGKADLRYDALGWRHGG